MVSNLSNFLVVTIILNTCLSFCCGARNEYNTSNHLDLTNITLIPSRRRLINVPNFNGQYTFLRGVAAIGWTGSLNTFCTGAYIPPPTGFTAAANKYYVVTAGHCLYERGSWPKATNGWTDNGVWEDVANLRVEFRLTGGAAPGALGIITCSVDDYRINNDYIMSNLEFPDDYAIMKLNCPVAPTDPFTIQNFVNSRHQDQEFGRAGYRGGRTLITEEHYRIRHSNQKADTDAADGMLISRGVSGGGDSGSPVYDADNPHNIRAVFSGKYWGPKRAVKITKSVHKTIDNLIKGKDGISVRTVDCGVSPYQNTECWSECVLATEDKPKKCYTSHHRTSNYLSPIRAIPCQFGRVKYLCGPIQDCSKADKDKKCLSTCTNNMGAHNCPADRPNIALAVNTLPSCKGRSGFSSFVGVKYVCRDVGHAVVNCADGTYDDTECWNPTTEHRKKDTGICFETNLQVRNYHKSGRYSERRDDRRAHKWLCGPVKDCTTDFRDKRCMSKCTDGGVPNCPANRAVIGGAIGPHTTINCQGRRGLLAFQGAKYLCDKIENIPNCGIGYLEEECWGPCTYKKPETCYVAPLQRRVYAKSERFKECGTQNQKYQRLCGTIKDCSAGFLGTDEISGRRCLGKCKVIEAESCPGTRTVTHTTERIPCGTGKWKWFCSTAAYEEDYGDEYIQYDAYNDNYDKDVNDYYDEYNDVVIGRNRVGNRWKKIKYIEQKMDEIQENQKDARNSLKRLHNAYNN